jgi:hypothetical protein
MKRQVVNALFAMNCSHGTTYFPVTWINVLKRKENENNLPNPGIQSTEFQIANFAKKNSCSSL